jgi:hypothetical protein
MKEIHIALHARTEELQYKNELSAIQFRNVALRIELIA